MSVSKISQRLFQIVRKKLGIRYFDDVLQFVDSHISVLLLINIPNPLPDAPEVCDFCLEIKSGNRLEAKFALSHTDMWTEVAHLINRVTLASFVCGESKLP